MFSKCEAVHPQCPWVMSLGRLCKRNEGKEEERRHLLNYSYSAYVNLSEKPYCIPRSFGGVQLHIYVLKTSHSALLLSSEEYNPFLSFSFHYIIMFIENYGLPILSVVSSPVELIVMRSFRLSVYFVCCLPLLLVPQIFPLNICFSLHMAINHEVTIFYLYDFFFCYPGVVQFIRGSN